MRNIIRIGAGTDGRNRFVAIALGVALAAGPAVALPAAALAAPATDAAAASTTAWLRVRRRIGSARSHWDFEPHSSQNPSSLLRCRDAMPMQAGHDTRSAFLTRCSTTTYGPSTLIRSWCPHACVTNLQAMTYRLPENKNRTSIRTNVLLRRGHAPV